MRINKSEREKFLRDLRRELRGMPREDVRRYLEYYTEMIEDRVSDGMTESDAIAALGAPDAIAAGILADEPPRKRRLNTLEIILIVLGAPIWVSLLLALLAVVLSVAVSLWSVVAALWAAELALAVSAPAGVVGCGIMLAQGNVPYGIALLGAGIFGFGGAILGFRLCKWATVTLAHLCVSGFQKMTEKWRNRK